MKAIRAYGASSGVPFDPSDFNHLATKENAPYCATCGRPMRLRSSSRGYFYGCSGYPTWCRSTQELNTAR